MIHKIVSHVRHSMRDEIKDEKQFLRGVLSDPRYPLPIRF